MSLAELKRRLQVGVRLRLVERPESRAVDEMKRVELVQTNAIAFGDPGCKRGSLCWIWWTKGMTVETTAAGFKLLWPNGNYLRYEWVPDSAAACVWIPRSRQVAADAPPIPGAADIEREGKLDAERVTLEFGSKSTKRLDAGRRPFDESPLFGGERQGRMF